MTNKMKDPNKDYVVFYDEVTPRMKLTRKRALKETDFEGYTYSHDHSGEIEFWVKQ